jgi:hypothetical protein
MVAANATAIFFNIPSSTLPDPRKKGPQMSFQASPAHCLVRVQFSRVY